MMTRVLVLAALLVSVLGAPWDATLADELYAESLASLQKENMTDELPDLAETMLAANNGDMLAQSKLGFMYLMGWRGVVRNETLALLWLERAAEAGEVDAMHNLAGVLMERNNGVVDEGAAMWFKRAAEAGNVESMVLMGRMLEFGKGAIERDVRESFAWYMRAAATGHGGAQTQVGLSFMTGKGVAEDNVAAAKWFRAAAAQGIFTSMINLGALARTGVGSDRADPHAALEWYERAAAVATLQSDRDVAHAAIKNLLSADEL
jgi:TPR repeat protein